MPIQANQYDAVPYESHPFAHTHPRQLRATAKIFGLNPPPLETARILELGCAAGGNVMPLAIDYPDAQIVGIDLSAKQIGDGQRIVDALGLRNITLKVQSILDVDDSLGQFDFIICHGVFSWVPAEVQAKILEICKRNLRENGVAFVSYNTLPGWNLVRSIREMMLYHTQFFADPAAKAQQARALLTFIEDATKGQQNVYAEMIRNEAGILKNQADWYLLHDHLEENNIQLYFHQFMAMAGKLGLAYLGDSSIATMYTGNLPEATAKALNAANDIVRIEQYMDFLNNRRFRNTLLVHGGQRINRNLKPALLDDMALTTTLSPGIKPEEIDLTKDQQISFVGPVTYTVNNRIMAALMLVLREQNGHPMALPEVIAAAAKRLDLADPAPVRKTLLDNAIRLVLAGALHLFSDPYREVTTVSARPAASPLARYQAAGQGWITNQRHMRVNLDMVQRVIVQALDGKNDVKAVTDRIVARVKTREFGVSRDGKELTEPAAIEAEVTRVVGDHLAHFARLGLLVA